MDTTNFWSVQIVMDVRIRNQTYDRRNDNDSLSITRIELYYTREIEMFDNSIIGIFLPFCLTWSKQFAFEALSVYERRVQTSIVQTPVNHRSNTLRLTKKKEKKKKRKKRKRKKNEGRATKTVHALCMAVRRSISGALIGGGKAGKRYITVWHDAAVWSAIYCKRTRLKPMINELAWPREKKRKRNDFSTISTRVSL